MKSDANFMKLMELRQKMHQVKEMEPKSEVDVALTQILEELIDININQQLHHQAY
jgi:hypothetical protein